MGQNVFLAHLDEKSLQIFSETFAPLSSFFFSPRFESIIELSLLCLPHTEGGEANLSRRRYT